MEEKRDFINEKIKKKSRAGKIFRRCVRVVVSAIVFGVIAVCTAVAIRPWAEKTFSKPEETTAIEIVTIARDEPEAEPETTIAKTEETENEPETEPVEDIVQSAIREYSYTMDDLNGLMANVTILCNDLDNSVVTVRAVTTEKDFFDNPMTKAGEYSGIVIAETAIETKILTMSDAVEGDEVVVIWNNEFEQLARICQVDPLSGLAVISVRKEEMDAWTRSIARPVKLGNSYLTKRGDLVIALGSPCGAVHSTAYGWISYVAPNIYITDGIVRLLVPDQIFRAEQGSWIVNTDGELIGWATDRIPLGQNNAPTMVVGISEIKSLLERMLNSLEYAYIGVIPAELAATEEVELPGGIYITEVLPDSPAYQAGIRPGDLLCRIGEKEILTVSDYRKALENLGVDDEITVVVNRESREGYSEVEYTLVTGKR